MLLQWFHSAIHEAKGSVLPPPPPPTSSKATQASQNSTRPGIPEAGSFVNRAPFTALPFQKNSTRLNPEAAGCFLAVQGLTWYYSMRMAHSCKWSCEPAVSGEHSDWRPSAL